MDVVSMISLIFMVVPGGADVHYNASFRNVAVRVHMSLQTLSSRIFCCDPAKPYRSSGVLERLTGGQHFALLKNLQFALIAKLEYMLPDWPHQLAPAIHVVVLKLSGV